MGPFYHDTIVSKFIWTSSSDLNASVSLCSEPTLSFIVFPPHLQQWSLSHWWVRFNIGILPWYMHPIVSYSLRLSQFGPSVCLKFFCVRTLQWCELSAVLLYSPPVHCVPWALGVATVHVSFRVEHQLDALCNQLWNSVIASICFKNMVFDYKYAIYMSVIIRIHIQHTMKNFIA